MNKPRRKWSELTDKERQLLQNRFQSTARNEVVRRHAEEYRECIEVSRQWWLQEENIEYDGRPHKPRQGKGPFA